MGIHAKKSDVWLVLALQACHVQVSAQEPPRVDVRAIEDWTIVASPDALESE